MRYGISFLPDCGPELKSPVEYFRDAIDLSVMADQGGLETVKMTEHYLRRYGGYCPDPLSFLAAVATRTQHIRLMTGCMLPAFHHPIQIAAHAAMVDTISGGRLDAGFARAYMPYEFASLGVPMDESTERFRQTIAAVTRLWTEQGVSEDGPFFSYRDVTSIPSPAQHPHPPIWGAASTTWESFQWIGAQGFGLLITPILSSVADFRAKLGAYRSSFSGGSGADARPQVAASVPLYIADTEEQARSEARGYLDRYLAVWTEAANSWMSASSVAYQGYSGLAPVLQATTGSDLIARGSAIVGTPDTVAEQIRALSVACEFTNADQILWQIDFGGMPIARSGRTLELFIEKVLPQLE